MKNRKNIKVAGTAIVLAGAFVLLVAGIAHATSFGDNITVFDGMPINSTTNNWYGGTNNSTGKEDHEVEPGMVTGQQWDLEGFFLKGKDLTVISGYNLFGGQTYGGYNYKMGDIFIGTQGTAVYSPSFPDPKPTITSNHEVSNSLYKYDYVLDIDWVARTYNVVDLNIVDPLVPVVLKLGYYGLNPNWPSNPWQYVSGGNIIDTGSLTQLFGLTDAQTGFTGDTTNGSHYGATFSGLSFLGAGDKLVFHTTMECGNDNLIGKAEIPVPEPGTILLLGSGLLGLGLLRRRRKS